MVATQQVVHSDPEIVSGTPVFVGSRVPLQNLFDYLKHGDPLDEFLDDFPSVSRERALAAIELARDALLDAAYGRGRSRAANPQSVVHSDPEIVGGAPVFVGTRVPVQTLTDHLAGGYVLAGIIDQFPSLRWEQAVAALELAQDVLLNDAYADARSAR